MTHVHYYYNNINTFANHIMPAHFSCFNIFDILTMVADFTLGLYTEAMVMLVLFNVMEDSCFIRFVYEYHCSDCHF